MKFYVNVQSLDHDDYPVGTPTKIGPFYSVIEAEEFLSRSPYFFKRTIFDGYEEWKMRQYGKHSVSIKTVVDGMQNPENYL